jgi:hypothetical protein
MRGMNIKVRVRNWRCGTGLWLPIVAMLLSEVCAQAQFAQVKGAITDTQNVKVPKSYVRVNANGANGRVVDAPIGDYVIENLQAGKYDFIACGFPHRPDRHKLTIKSNQATTLNFVLTDPPQIHPPASLTLLGFHEASADGVAYLKDPKSGCLVAQARPNEKGEVEFPRWQPGDQVCIRDRNREEYKCISTLNTSR